MNGSHLMAATRYVERNLVKAKLVAEADKQYDVPVVRIKAEGRHNSQPMKENPMAKGNNAQKKNIKKPKKSKTAKGKK